MGSSRAKDMPAKFSSQCLLASADLFKKSFDMVFSREVEVFLSCFSILPCDRIFTIVCDVGVSSSAFQVPPNELGVPHVSIVYLRSSIQSI